MIAVAVALTPAGPGVALVQAPDGGLAGAPVTPARLGLFAMFTRLAEPPEPRTGAWRIKTADWTVEQPV